MTRPDRTDMECPRLPGWQLAPRAPYLEAKRAFVLDGRAISYAESCMGIVEHHGLGIPPTIPVAKTRAGVAAGRDERLERAVEAVRR